MTQRKVSLDSLRELVLNCCLASGIPKEDADIFTDCLIAADLVSITTHGVDRLPVYLDRIKLGVTKVPTNLTVLKESGASIFLDANDGLGQVAAFKSAKLAIERAKQNGVGAVVVKNSGHFGRAGYFTEQIAQEGLIGFCCTNASPRLAPWGGTKALLGNNPWSFAFPKGKKAPRVVFDIANSVVAAGKIREAANKHEKIPENWALTDEGRPTIDPKEALKGILLPMAGHKGYGISLWVALLTGALSGSEWDSHVTNIYDYSRPQKVSHFIMAIDLRAFAGKDNYMDILDDMYSKIKSSSLAEGFKEVYLPGEIEELKRESQIKEGVSLSPVTIQKLANLTAKLNISLPQDWFKLM
ncbi:MAG: Ldh family oxidoreductase [Dehalobacterium sp.]